MLPATLAIAETMFGGSNGIHFKNYDAQHDGKMREIIIISDVRWFLVISPDFSVFLPT